MLGGAQGHEVRPVTRMALNAIVERQEQVAVARKNSHPEVFAKAQVLQNEHEAGHQSAADSVANHGPSDSQDADRPMPWPRPPASWGDPRLFEWKLEHRAWWCKLCNTWVAPTDDHIRGKKHSARIRNIASYVMLGATTTTTTTIAKAPPPPPPPPPLPPQPPSTANASDNGRLFIRSPYGVSSPWPPPLPPQPSWGALAAEPPPSAHLAGPEQMVACLGAWAHAQAAMPAEISMPPPMSPTTRAAPPPPPLPPPQPPPPPVGGLSDCIWV